MRGTEMEAHAGTIRIGTGIATRPQAKAGRLQAFRERARARRRERTLRAQAVQANRGPRSIPGSEHTHLILPRKA
jgi:hypothetical protein